MKTDRQRQREKTDRQIDNQRQREKDRDRDYAGERSVIKTGFSNRMPFQQINSCLCIPAPKIRATQPMQLLLCFFRSFFPFLYIFYAKYWSHFQTFFQGSLELLTWNLQPVQHTRTPDGVVVYCCFFSSTQLEFTLETTPPNTHTHTQTHTHTHTHTPHNYTLSHTLAAVSSLILSPCSRVLLLFVACLNVFWHRRLYHHQRPCCHGDPRQKGLTG